VVVAWGLSQLEEQEIVQQVARKCEEQPLPPGEVEIDQVRWAAAKAGGQGKA
jgi:uncharacterized Rmd1/YagE family protein